MARRFSNSMRQWAARIALSLGLSPIILLSTGFSNPTTAYASDEIVQEVPSETEPVSEESSTESASLEVVPEESTEDDTQSSVDEDPPAAATADESTELASDEETATSVEESPASTSEEATSETDATESPTPSESPEPLPEETTEPADSEPTESSEVTSPETQDSTTESPSVEEEPIIDAPTVVVTAGGDDMSYQVPLSDVVVFFGQTYNSIFATTNAVITFGAADGTYWDYPMTPSISLGSQDWTAYSFREDEHFIISYTENAFQVDMSVRPYGASTDVAPSRIVLSGVIAEDRTVTFAYYLENTEQYGNLRFGVRTPDGEVKTLEEVGFYESTEAPSEDGEILIPAPEPEPEVTEPEAPVTEPEPENEPNPSPEVEEESPTEEETPEPSPEPTPTEDPEPVPPTQPEETLPTPLPEPELEPEPQPEPVQPVEPEPTPQPESEVAEDTSSEEVTEEQTPEPETPTEEVLEQEEGSSSSSPSDEENLTPQPVEPSETELPKPKQPEQPTKEPAPLEPEEQEKESLSEPAPINPLDNPNSTTEEKVKAIISLLETGESIDVAILIENGISFSDLPPETPVQVREDENGNPVIITAEVAAALAVLDSPEKMLTALLENPAALINAFMNVGKDMSEEERAESQKVVVAAVIVGNIANIAATAAAAAPAVYRRRP